MPLALQQLIVAARVEARIEAAARSRARAEEALQAGDRRSARKHELDTQRHLRRAEQLRVQRPSPAAN